MGVFNHENLTVLPEFLTNVPAPGTLGWRSGGVRAAGEGSRCNLATLRQAFRAAQPGKAPGDAAYPSSGIRPGSVMGIKCNHERHTGASGHGLGHDSCEFGEHKAGEHLH
jgi:hypothetical protein